VSAAAACHRAIKWSQVQRWHLLRSGAKPPSQFASLQVCLLCRCHAIVV
jgi:hypothetical protein